MYGFKKSMVKIGQNTSNVETKLIFREHSTHLRIINCPKIRFCHNIQKVEIEDAEEETSAAQKTTKD